MSCGICNSLRLPSAITSDSSLPHESWHDLYLEEILAASAKWPLINLIEVALRNRISHQLENRFGADFFLQEPRQLMAAERGRLRDAQRECSALTMQEVIRKLPMGFWLQLLSKKYESTLWAPALWRTFPAWDGTSRKLVHEEITAVWKLRNRIAHHESTRHDSTLPSALALGQLLLGLEPDFDSMINSLQPVEFPHEQ
jgi:hypothetical protein